MSEGAKLDNPDPGHLFSLVIPFYNEEDTVRQVLSEAREVLPLAEIIAIDDGSTDRTWEYICGFSAIRGYRLTENRGQSAAVYLGLKHARGACIGLMDGDGQNDPADFPVLMEMRERDNLDVVCGYRMNRKDTLSKRVASRFANRIRRIFLADGIWDTGCSVKVFRREAVESLIPFNGMHRYLPAIFRNAGLRIGECPVNHRPRLGGDSKYTNWERALRGIYDLVGVSWLLRRKINYPNVERS